MYIAISKHGETVGITFVANVVAGGVQAANFPAKSNAQHSRDRVAPSIGGIPEAPRNPALPPP